MIKEKIVEPGLVKKKEEFSKLLNEKIRLIEKIINVKELIGQASLNEENSGEIMNALVASLRGLERIQKINLQLQELIKKEELEIILITEVRIIKETIENLNKGISPNAKLVSNEFNKNMVSLKKLAYLMEAKIQ